MRTPKLGEKAMSASKPYIVNMQIRGLVFCFLLLFVCQSCWAQKPEYDFYPEFLNTFAPTFYLARPASSLKDVVAAYAAELKAKGIDPNEIARREQLILENKPALEADYWDRFYLDPNSKVNRGPNAFLVEVMRGRIPGVALDYAMGKAGILFISPSWAGRSGASIRPQQQYVSPINAQRRWV